MEFELFLALNSIIYYMNSEIQLIQNKIHNIRNEKVMIDYDLADLYETETKSLKRAVNRNKERFPEDFMPACCRQVSTYE